MSFIVQDPDAPASDANAYISIAYFKAYHDDRGNSYSSFSDSDIEESIVRVTDYQDSRWTFAGYREDINQSTECPRSGVYDPRTGFEVDHYPPELEEAAAEYAMIALSGSLYAAPNIDTTGLKVKITKKKVAVLETETEYFQGGSNSNAWVGWPAADAKMKKTRLLTSTRRTLGRG